MTKERLRRDPERLHGQKAVLASEGLPGQMTGSEGQPEPTNQRLATATERRVGDTVRAIRTNVGAGDKAE